MGRAVATAYRSGATPGSALGVGGALGVGTSGGAGGGGSGSAATGSSAPGALEAEYNRPLPDSDVSAAFDGPVVAWFRAHGVDSLEQVRLARALESAAHVRPPMVQAAIVIDKLQLTVSDVQYQDAMHLVSLLALPPIVTPLPLDVAMLALELGLPPPPTFLGRTAKDPAPPVDLPGDGVERLKNVYRRLWYARTVALAIADKSAPPAMAATATIGFGMSGDTDARTAATAPAAVERVAGLPLKHAVRLWLVESFLSAVDSAACILRTTPAGGLGLRTAVELRAAAQAEFDTELARSKARAESSGGVMRSIFSYGRASAAADGRGGARPRPPPPHRPRRRRRPPRVLTLSSLTATAPPRLLKCGLRWRAPARRRAAAATWMGR